MMRTLVVSVLVFVVLNLFLPTVWERVTTSAPEIVLRLILFIGALICVGLALLSEPVFRLISQPRQHAVVSTVIVAVAFGVLAGSAWWAFRVYEHKIEAATGGEPPVVLVEFPSSSIYRGDSPKSPLNKMPTVRTVAASVLNVQVQDIAEGPWVQSFLGILELNTTPVVLVPETTSYPAIPKGYGINDLMPGTSWTRTLDGLFNIAATSRGWKTMPLEITFNTASGIKYRTLMRLDLYSDGSDSIGVHVNYTRTELVPSQ